mmetsp:Transcript_2246/g.8149  ORF Transcript_2246/g.8149 Transcript_2246/m.8149 type:complete len:243 (+) Transcript_2246:249-977(+)
MGFFSAGAGMTKAAATCKSSVAGTCSMTLVQASECPSPSSEPIDGYPACHDAKAGEFCMESEACPKPEGLEVGFNCGPGELLYRMECASCRKGCTLYQEPMMQGCDYPRDELPNCEDVTSYLPTLCLGTGACRTDPSIENCGNLTVYMQACEQSGSSVDAAPATCPGEREACVMFQMTEQSCSGIPNLVEYDYYKCSQLTNTMTHPETHDIVFLENLCVADEECGNVGLNSCFGKAMYERSC